MITPHQCISVEADTTFLLDKPIYFLKDSDLTQDRSDEWQEVDNFLEQTQVYPRSEMVQNLIQALQR